MLMFLFLILLFNAARHLLSPIAYRHIVLTTNLFLIVSISFLRFWSKKNIIGYEHHVFQTRQKITSTNYTDDVGNGHPSAPKRKVKSAKRTPLTVSTEDILQEQTQSLLRLDGAVKKYTSNTAKRSFHRHSSNLHHNQRTQNDLKRNLGGLSNSRSSISSFAKRPHEKSFDKERDKRRREEGYFEDLAKALKKAKRGKK